jgi:predicted kinase
MGGKPGAGKSTLARELGRTLPAVVICEDEWIQNLGFQIRSFEDYREAARRCHAVIEPLARDLLRVGVAVVLDVPANTPEARARVRSLFEPVGAAHVLHWIDGSDAECLTNVRRRNEEKPTGVYWGPVSDEMFHLVLPRIVPPSTTEGFNVVRHTVVVRG